MITRIAVMVVAGVMVVLTGCGGHHPEPAVSPTTASQPGQVTPPRLPTKFELAVEAGTEASKKKDFDLALAYAEEAIRLEPSKPDGYALRGATLCQKGVLVDWEADFKKALELDPDCFDAYMYRGLLTYKFNPTQAVSDGSNAIRIKPKSADAYVLRGLGYQWLYPYDKSRAVADWKKALEFDPNHADAVKNLKAVGEWQPPTPNRDTKGQDGDTKKSEDERPHEEQPVPTEKKGG